MQQIKITLFLGIGLPALHLVLEKKICDNFGVGWGSLSTLWPPSTGELRPTKPMHFLYNFGRLERSGRWPLLLHVGLYGLTTMYADINQKGLLSYLLIRLMPWGISVNAR